MSQPSTTRPARLSAASRDVVAATLPAVGGAIDQITPLFYSKMFAAHPELIRDLFNRGNQSQGDQPKALAASIAAFATLQLEPDDARLQQVLTRIAHKHASLGVLPEQYPIVHEHLFAAIVEVLGDAVTPEVAAAWDELYWLMAHTLIAMERDLYDAAGVEPGGVWRTVRVTERRQQTSDTVSFTLAPLGDETLPDYLPGQYLSVAVTLPDGARQIRQYSLVWAPEPNTWRISVKRIAATDGAPAGEVSGFLYENVYEDDELAVTTPFGDLTLVDDDAPILLASAGIGVTPILGILSHLAAGGDPRPVSVIHADRSFAAHAHRSELLDLTETMPAATTMRWYEDLGRRTVDDSIRAGLADLSDVPVDPRTQAYLCGPLPFMMSLRSQLIGRGVPPANVHYEVFGPDAWTPAE